MFTLMETQRTSQSFCGRPGCGIAKSMHGKLTSACAAFIAPGSAEANALRREMPTPMADEPIDAHLLDRVLMAGALEHLQTRIARATGCLQRGLSYQRAKMDKLAQQQFSAALKALGGLGAA